MSGKFAHNLRLHDVKNADPEKRHLNRVLYGEDNIKDIFQISVEEAAQRHKRKELKTYIDRAEEDKWMIEKADLVVAYITHDWGGAYQSYRHAKRKGKKIENLAEWEEK